MSNLVRYSGFSAEEFEKETERVKSLSGAAFMRWAEGENVVRLLPSPAAAGRAPMRTTNQHFVKNVPGLPNKVFSFACPRTELRQPCLVCAKVEALTRSNNPLDKKLAEDIAAKPITYVNLIDRNAEDLGPRTIGLTGGQLKQLKAIRINPRLGGDFFNPNDDGFDLIVLREGSGLQTKYTIAADRNRSPLSRDVDQINDWIENQPDLESVVKPIIAEELIQIWGELSGRPAPVIAAARQQVATQLGTGHGVGAGMFKRQASAVDNVRAVATDDDFGD
jgi:hypothetical protein